jgi:pseudouridine synthase
MADAGIASRRECERLIESGAVEVNGEVVTQLPCFVVPGVDRIIVDGRPMRKTPERLLYLMFNKPARVLTTLADEPGSDRRTVMDYIDHPQKARLFPVGRLDFDTTGLLLVTNDGELANRLTHPRYGVAKTYLATVKGQVADDAADAIAEGIYLADRKAGKTVGASRTARVEVQLVSRQRDRTTIELTLREGRNRQVRRLLAAVGYPVRKLERIGMGPLTLKGVAPGQWRELDRHELRAIKRAAAAGPDQQEATPPRPKLRPLIQAASTETRRSASSERKPTSRTTGPKAGTASNKPAPAKTPHAPRGARKPSEMGSPSAAKPPKPSASVTRSKPAAAKKPTGKPARANKPSGSPGATRASKPGTRPKTSPKANSQARPSRSPDGASGKSPTSRRSRGPSTRNR